MQPLRLNRGSFWLHAGALFLFAALVTPSHAAEPGSSAATVEEARAAVGRKDYPLAMRLWRELADQNNAAAMFSVGVLYQKGWGTATDEAEAVRWFLRAAQQGNEAAQEALYFAYSSGKGVAVNYAEAAKWIRPLADKGYAMSQLFLASLYLQGMGVERNFIEAYKWSTLAARDKLTSAVAGEALKQLRPKMSAADITEAERLVQAWQPQPKKP